MAEVALHYWAGARAAAGVEWDRFDVDTVAAALARAVDVPGRERLTSVLPACSLLVDGVALSVHDVDTVLDESVSVEVLPPFAGG